MQGIIEGAVKVQSDVGASERPRAAAIRLGAIELPVVVVDLRKSIPSDGLDKGGSDVNSVGSCGWGRTIIAIAPATNHDDTQ